MRRRLAGRGLRYGVAAVALLAATSGPALAAGGGLPQTTQFYVPPPNAGALQQRADLLASGDRADAGLIRQLIRTPQAVWFTSGTPHQVQAAVRRTVRAAHRAGTVPVLVAYDIPGRDCAQYSAGGALDTASYLAWVDGFAKGVGGYPAVVILEPDSLGLLPSNCGGPSPTYPFTDADRFTQLNGAVDRLEQLSKVSVYLDGTHSHWLAVGDITARLVYAGVQRAQGFFLNVSNYRASSDLQHFGTWISKCIAFGTDPEEGGWRLGHFDWCASQYYSPNGPVNPDDPSTWHFTDDWYNANMGTAVPTTHFVVDTSRNGQGANYMTAYAAAPYNQPADVISHLVGGNWCNPPGSGTGIRPTANTHDPLLDAYLWVKIPGESDGACAAGADGSGPRAWDYTLYNPWGIGTDAQPSFDPLWGMVDPNAGAWFPQQALQLAQLANPT